MEYIYICVIAVLLAIGLWRVSAAILYHDRYSTGKKNLQQIGKWQKDKQEFWDMPMFLRCTTKLKRIVFLDDTAKESLRRQLHRAGMDITPEEFTARKYVIFLFVGILIVCCVLLQFWFGIILCALIGVYGVMRQRESLTARIKARDEAIAMEMPRFVRYLRGSCFLSQSRWSSTGRGDLHPFVSYANRRCRDCIAAVPETHRH